MHIINMLNNYWLDIVIVLMMATALYFVNRLLVKYGKDKKVKRVLSDLIIEAEKYLKTEAGILKKKQVMVWFRNRYPLLSPLITDKNLDILIDKLVDILNKDGLSELTVDK